MTNKVKIKRNNDKPKIDKDAIIYLHHLSNDLERKFAQNRIATVYVPSAIKVKR